MAISEEIILQDSVSGPADAAAASTLALADALERAAAAAREASGSAAKAATADKALGSAAQSAAGGQNALAGAAQKAGGAAQSGSKGWALNADALTNLAEKAVKAAMMVGKLIVAIGKVAVKAVTGREQLKLMLDQATRGKGAEALAGIDRMAKALGLSAQEATEQFVAFRNQGLKAIDSANLIKLRADLLAVGVSADVAESAIDKTVEAIRQGGDAKAAIAATAAEFGAVGNGANASAAKVHTVKGAIDNAMNAAQRFGDRVAEALAPAFESAANAATEFLDAVEQSSSLQAMIEAIKVAFDGFGEGFMAAAKPVIGLFKSLGNAMGGTKGNLENTKNGFKAVGAVIGAVVTVVGAVIVAVIAVPAAFAAAWEGAVAGVAAAIGAIVDFAVAVGEAIGGAVEAVGQFASDFFQAGADLINGFIEGIMSMASAVGDAVSGLGAQAADSLKSALGIGSPSKVAMAMGANFGQSFNDAIESSMPAAIQAPTFGGRGTALAPHPGGGSPVNVVVNVSQSNATAEDIRTAVARGVESGMRMARV